MKKMINSVSRNFKKRMIQVGAVCMIFCLVFSFNVAYAKNDDNEEKEKNIPNTKINVHFEGEITGISAVSVTLSNETVTTMMEQEPGFWKEADNKEKLVDQIKQIDVVKNDHTMTFSTWRNSTEAEGSLNIWITLQSEQNNAGSSDENQGSGSSGENQGSGSSDENQGSGSSNEVQGSVGIDETQNAADDKAQSDNQYQTQIIDGNEAITVMDEEVFSASEEQEEKIAVAAQPEEILPTEDLPKTGGNTVAYLISGLLIATSGFILRRVQK
jgi:LPXTG-motif cell wall-anchored protein